MARDAREVEMMRTALALAREAGRAGEVPVGALVAHEGRVLGTGANRVIRDADPAGHAEIVALRAAAKSVGNYRLPGTTLFVTLEPCAMCAGAIVHARIERVVFAAFDPRAGAGGSIFNLLDSPHLNHRCLISAGLMAGEAAALLDIFFDQRR